MESSYYSGFSLYAPIQRTAVRFRDDAGAYGFYPPTLAQAILLLSNTDFYKNVEGLLRYFGNGITQTDTPLGTVLDLTARATGLSAFQDGLFLASELMRKYREDENFRASANKYLISPLEDFSRSWNSIEKVWEYTTNTIEGVLENLGNWIHKNWIEFKGMIDYIIDAIEKLSFDIWTAIYQGASMNLGLIMIVVVGTTYYLGGWGIEKLIKSFRRD